MFAEKLGEWSGVVNLKGGPQETKHDADKVTREAPSVILAADVRCGFRDVPHLALIRTTQIPPFDQ